MKVLLNALLSEIIGVLLILSGITACIIYFRAWLSFLQRNLVFGIAFASFGSGMGLLLFHDLRVLICFPIMFVIIAVSSTGIAAGQEVALTAYRRFRKKAKQAYLNGDMKEARTYVRLADDLKRSLGRLKYFKPKE